ncbi:hypothetical protein AJ79_01376 [Helicocarpus griseus UAMH5409]|uniref:HNH nuclease domain-containing protein n=1 Tax=Helicocarpus griseus UAMH5409 TaxID=1447875 RepID=A0A2B7Y7Y8_9EURO|nr:hypothetical protein AJ79_01376 [Helicocarpus griseus UAMH5409]
MQAAPSALRVPADSESSRKRKINDARERINRYVPGQQANDDKLIACLHAFPDWLPEEGVDFVVHEVVKCGENDNRLYQCFADLLRSVLYIVKLANMRFSVAASPAELDETQYDESLFYEMCARRDGYCCVVTKQMDTGHWESLNRPSDVVFGDLEVAHIIAIPCASIVDDPSRHAGTVWESLFRCFPSLRRTCTYEGRPNDPSNGIALRDSIHKQFRKFGCALEPTDTPYVYNFRTYKIYSPEQEAFLPPDRKVTMRADGVQGVPLPSRDLLACHWRVAEILKASGMDEVVEQLILKWEDMKDSSHGCLREDGTSDVSEYVKAAFWERIAEC